MTTPPYGAASDDEALRALSETNNELINMHRSLAKQGAELAEANRRKDIVLGMVAHDLRNPLGAIVSFAELLQRRLDDCLSDQDRLMLERIEAQGRRMLTLVEDLVDASIIGQGIIELDLEDTDLSALLEDTHAVHGPAAQRKGIALLVATSREPVHARVDRDRIAQVLDNLVGNAIKFSPVDAGAVVRLAGATAGDEVVLEVSDDGIGIDDDVRDRLFEPFAHTIGRGTSGEPSTGLGLAITRSLVEAHGGRITVDSQPGVGSTFTVRLPRDGPPTRPPAASGHPNP